MFNLSFYSIFRTPEQVGTHVEYPVPTSTELINATRNPNK